MGWAGSRDDEGEFPAAAPEYFFYLQMHVMRSRDEMLESLLEPHGLTVARWRTLTIIRQIRPCIMKNLALFSRVDRTTLTRALDQLVEDGLVERTTPKHDRRQVDLTLTARGEQIHEAAHGTVMDLNRRMLEAVPEKMQRDLIQSLRTMVRTATLEPLRAEAILAAGIPAGTEPTEL
jgi:DNA-binding MarR family transcriptional regulator